MSSSRHVFCLCRETSRCSNTRQSEGFCFGDKPREVNQILRFFGEERNSVSAPPEAPLGSSVSQSVVIFSVVFAHLVHLGYPLM